MNGSFVIIYNILLFSEFTDYLSQDEWENTFLHYAVEFRSTATVNSLLSVIPPHLITYLLFVRGRENQTVLHRAIQNEKHDNLIRVLLEFIEKNCSTEGGCV